jgi:predicted esterase
MPGLAKFAGMVSSHSLTISRSARFHTLGTWGGSVRDLWYVCHGYGQLAVRFLEAFAPLAAGDRLVVAPEGLSRFYLDTSSAGKHADKVGASWMTREDRDHEIADYVAYLTHLHERVAAGLDRVPARVVVLGFSQGCATAARWVTRGKVPARSLILWGGGLPPDVDPGSTRLPPLTLVIGKDDQFIPPAEVNSQKARLERAGLAYRLVSYAGGHRIDPETLRQVADSLPDPIPR